MIGQWGYIDRLDQFPGDQFIALGSEHVGGRHADVGSAGANSVIGLIVVTDDGDFDRHIFVQLFLRPLRKAVGDLGWSIAIVHRQRRSWAGNKAAVARSRGTMQRMGGSWTGGEPGSLSSKALIAQA